MVCLCLVAGMEEYMEVQQTDQQLSPQKNGGLHRLHLHACPSARSARTEKDAIRIHVSSFLDLHAGPKVESNNASCSCSFLTSFII